MHPSPREWPARQTIVLCRRTLPLAMTTDDPILSPPALWASIARSNSSNTLPSTTRLLALVGLSPAREARLAAARSAAETAVEGRAPPLLGGARPFGGREEEEDEGWEPPDDVDAARSSRVAEDDNEDGLGCRLTTAFRADDKVAPPPKGTEDEPSPAADDARRAAVDPELLGGEEDEARLKRAEVDDRALPPFLASGFLIVEV